MGVGGSCRSGFSRELLEPGCLGDWLETHPHPTLPLKGRALHRRACLSVRGRTASSSPSRGCPARRPLPTSARPCCRWGRSEEHTSEHQSLMRISYAVFCLKKKNKER